MAENRGQTREILLLRFRPLLLAEISMHSPEKLKCFVIFKSIHILQIQKHAAVEKNLTFPIYFHK